MAAAASVFYNDVYIDGYVDVEGQIISELADGGLSPLSIISTVMNPNLNSDLLDGYHAIAFPRKAENAAITGSWSYTTAPTITTWGTNPNSVATYGQITALGVSGTAGRLVKFATATSLGNSIVTETSGKISVAGSAAGTFFDSNDVPGVGIVGLTMSNAGSIRWQVGKNGTESTANAGSNFIIQRYSDAGSSIGTNLSISRATGIATFSSNVRGADPLISSDFVTKGYADITYVPMTRTVTAGTGLLGGGALSANITLSVAFGLTHTTVAYGDHTHITTDIAEGTNLYFTDTRGRAIQMTGLSLLNSAVGATDSLITSIGKIQGQINAISTSVLGTPGVIPKYATVGLTGSVMSETSGAITATGKINATYFESRDVPGAGIVGLTLSNAGSLRWQLGKNTTESGSNAGSNLIFQRYDDAGASLGTAFSINRATGAASFSAVVAGITPTASNHLTTKAYVDGAALGYVSLSLNGTTTPLLGATDADTVAISSAILSSTFTNTPSASGFLTSNYYSSSGSFSQNFVNHGTQDAWYYRKKSGGVVGAWEQVASRSFVLATYTPLTRTMTVNGTAGRISSTAGAQDFTANRSWTVDLVTTGITAGTYQSLTVDAYGRATAGSSISVTAGTGLTGGGPLSSNITLNWDTTYGDGRYALIGRLVSAGTGLTGGGDLSANRTISFDTTWGDARYSLSGHTHATLTRGNALTGSNYNGGTATTWAVDLGTSHSQAAYGDHTHLSSDITNFTGSVRTSISASGSLSYNNSTGVISYTAASGVSGTGTSGYHAMWNGSSSLTNSNVYDNGSELNFNNTRSFGVEGIAAFRDILHAWKYFAVGSSGTHGQIIVHNSSSVPIDPNLCIDVVTTTRGSRPWPSVTRAQRLAMSTTDGMVVYQNNTVGASLIGLKIFWGSLAWMHIEMNGTDV